MDTPKMPSGVGGHVDNTAEEPINASLSELPVGPQPRLLCFGGQQAKGEVHAVREADRGHAGLGLLPDRPWGGGRIAADRRGSADVLEGDSEVQREQGARGRRKRRARGG